MYSMPSVPFYVNMNKILDLPLQIQPDKVTTEDFYWTNQIVGRWLMHIIAVVLLTLNVTNCLYNQCTEIINKFDEKILKEELSYENATKICELANEKIEKRIKNTN